MGGFEKAKNNPPYFFKKSPEGGGGIFSERVWYTHTKFYIWKLLLQWKSVDGSFIGCYIVKSKKLPPLKKMMTLFFFKATFLPRNLVNTEQILTVFDFGRGNHGKREPTKNVAIKKKKREMIFRKDKNIFLPPL